MVSQILTCETKTVDAVLFSRRVEQIFLFFSFISALFYIIFGRRKKEFEEEEEEEEEPIQLRQLKSGGTNEREFLRVRDSMLVNVQPQC